MVPKRHGLEVVFMGLHLPPFAMVHALPPAVSILRVVTFAKGRAATSISLALALGHEKKIPIFPFGNFAFFFFFRDFWLRPG